MGIKDLISKYPESPMINRALADGNIDVLRGYFMGLYVAGGIDHDDYVAMAVELLGVLVKKTADDVEGVR